MGMSTPALTTVCAGMNDDGNGYLGIDGLSINGVARGDLLRELAVLGWQGDRLCHGMSAFHLLGLVCRSIN